MGPEGLSVRWEIDSKTLQSSIFLRPEVSFAIYTNLLISMLPSQQTADQSALIDCWIKFELRTKLDAVDPYKARYVRGHQYRMQSDDDGL